MWNQIKKNKGNVTEKITMVKETAYKGPIPDPLSLGHYEQILPWSAHRIIEMAEKEQNFRHVQTHSLINKEYFTQILWMIFAFIICVLVLIYSFYLIILWKNIQAMGLIIFDFLAFAGVFLANKVSKQKKISKELKQE